MLLVRARVRNELAHAAGRARDLAHRIERADEVALAILRSNRLGDEHVPLSEGAACVLDVVQPDRPAAAVQKSAPICYPEALRLLDGHAALGSTRKASGNFDERSACISCGR